MSAPQLTMETSEGDDRPLQLIRRERERAKLDMAAEPMFNAADLVALRLELNGYYDAVCEFADMEPDVVLLQISGISARLTEIRAFLIRRNQIERARSLRTSEIDPMLTELDKQFKIHSRLIAMRELDWKMAGPQV